MSTFKKFLAAVLIVTGMAIMGYPTVVAKLNEQEQAQMLEKWDEMVQGEDALKAPDLIQTSVRAGDEPPLSIEADPYVMAHMMGLLKIEAIDLRLPVLDDSKASNLSIAPTKVKSTGQPDQVGNFCIAGHRNKKFGKNFNRLDELKVGDRAEFVMKDKTIYYEMVAKTVVQPENLDVLKTHRFKEMTLITCHPLGSSKQRLILTFKEIANPKRQQA